MTEISKKLNAVILSIFYVLDIYTVASDSNVFHKDHQKIIAINGSEALMKCYILVNLNLSQYMNISWIKSPRQILTRGFYRVTENNRFHPQSPAILNTQSFNLKIYPVLIEDEGQYRCNFIFGRKIFVKEVTLVVHVPPKITKHPASLVKVDEDKKIKLTCQAFGKPQPNISWYLATYPVGELKLTPIHYALGSFDTDIIASDGNLIIEKANRKMYGTYRCIAESILGSVFWDTRILVLYPPEIIMANEVITQNINQNTVVECTMSSYPLGQINWYFGNISLKTVVCGVFTDKSAKYCMEEQRPVSEANEVKVISRLNLINLDKHDFGIYTCKSKTLLGSASGSTHVKMTTVHSLEAELLPFDLNVIAKNTNRKSTLNILNTRSSNNLQDSNSKQISGHKSMELHQQSRESSRLSIPSPFIILNTLLVLIIN